MLSSLKGKVLVLFGVLLSTLFVLTTSDTTAQTPGVDWEAWLYDGGSIIRVDSNGNQIDQQNLSMTTTGQMTMPDNVAFSHDGRYVAYVVTDSNNAHNKRLMLYDTQTQSVTGTYSIPANPGDYVDTGLNFYAQKHVFGPRDGKLALGYQVASGWEIVVLNVPNGNVQKRLRSSGAVARSMRSFSGSAPVPRYWDGDRLYFTMVRTRAGGSQEYPSYRWDTVNNSVRTENVFRTLGSDTMIAPGRQYGAVTILAVPDNSLPTQGVTFPGGVTQANALHYAPLPSLSTSPVINNPDTTFSSPEYIQNGSLVMAHAQNVEAGGEEWRLLDRRGNRVGRLGIGSTFPTGIRGSADGVVYSANAGDMQQHLTVQLSTTQGSVLMYSQTRGRSSYGPGSVMWIGSANQQAKLSWLGDNLKGQRTLEAYTWNTSVSGGSGSTNQNQGQNQNNNGGGTCSEELGPISNVVSGDTLEVTDVIAELNLRSEPALAGDVLAEMPSGQQVTVVSGPQFADGFNWWEITVGNGLRGWAADTGAIGGRCVRYLSAVQTGSGNTGGSGQQSTSVFVDFETPDIGNSQGRIINPYSPGGGNTPRVSFRMASVSGFGGRQVGLTTQTGTSACVESEPQDDQVLGVSAGGDTDVGSSYGPVEAQFNQQVQASANSPITVAVDVQAGLNETAQLELIGPAGTVVATGTRALSQPQGTCGFPGNPRSSVRVQATAQQNIVAARVSVQGNTAGGGVVWVMDDFAVGPPGTTNTGSGSGVIGPGAGGQCGVQGLVPACQIGIGRTVNGQLQGETAELYFDAQGGETVTIELNSQAFDPVLTLTDPNGNQVARNDDRGDGTLNSRIENVSLPTQGTYIIGVDSFQSGSRGSYTLSLQQGGSSGSGAQQVFGVVGQIGVGQSVNNTLQGSSANWALNASSGQTLTIDLTSQAFDPVVRVQRTDGTEVASNDDRGDGSLNSRIQNFTVPAQGQYVITVESFGGGTGSYTLSVSQAGSRSSSSSGGSGGQLGNPVSIQPISVGQTVNGNLTSGTTDMYGFQASPSDVVTIDLTSPAFDTVLELQDPNGNQVERNDDFGNSLNSRIEDVTLLGQGQYVITVSSFGDGGSGSYTLSLSQGTASSSTRGNQLTIGDTVNDRLSTGSTQYTFTGSSGDVVTIDLTSPAFDTKVNLMGPNGNQVTSNDDRGDGTLNSRIQNFTLPRQGQYVITVTSFSGSGSGVYTLSLQSGS